MGEVTSPSSGTGVDKTVSDGINIIKSDPLHVVSTSVVVAVMKAKKYMKTTS